MKRLAEFAHCTNAWDWSFWALVLIVVFVLLVE